MYVIAESLESRIKKIKNHCEILVQRSPNFQKPNTKNKRHFRDNETMITFSQ